MQWLWAQAVVIAVTRAMTEQLHRWQAQRKLMAVVVVIKLQQTADAALVARVIHLMVVREAPQVTERDLVAGTEQTLFQLAQAAAAAAAVQLVAMRQQMAPWQDRMGDWAATDFQQADCLQD